MNSEPIQIGRIRKGELHKRVLALDALKKTKLMPSQLPLGLLSKKRDERVTVPANTPSPECLSCGVCCVFAVIVPLTYIESLIVPGYVDILLDDEDDEIVIDRVLPRDEDGRCSNLYGELGRSIGCSIYESRPSPCRDFDVGSDRCFEYRRMYGIDAQLSPEEEQAARERLDNVVRPEVIEDVAIIPTGTIERTSFSVEDGTSATSSARQLTIVVFLSDEEPHELHTFEEGNEIWFESELLGLTLEQAKVKIEKQAGLQSGVVV